MIRITVGSLPVLNTVWTIPSGSTNQSPGSSVRVTPRVIVSLAPVAPGPNDDRGRLAQQLAASIPGIKDARIVNSEAVRIGGSPGHEVRVEATAVKEDKPITVVQWLRFGTGSTLRIVAGATRDDWPQAFPRFRAVRDGIGPKEK